MSTNNLEFDLTNHIQDFTMLRVFMDMVTDYLRNHNLINAPISSAVLLLLARMNIKTEGASSSTAEPITIYNITRNIDLAPLAVFTKQADTTQSYISTIFINNILENYAYMLRFLNMLHKYKKPDNNENEALFMQLMKLRDICTYKSVPKTISLSIAIITTATLIGSLFLEGQLGNDGLYIGTAIIIAAFLIAYFVYSTISNYRTTIALKDLELFNNKHEITGNLNSYQHKDNHLQFSKTALGLFNRCIEKEYGKYLQTQNSLTSEV